MKATLLNRLLIYSLLNFHPYHNKLISGHARWKLPNTFQPQHTASNARSSRTVNNLVEVLPEVTEEGHDAIACDKQIKCTNCNFDHMSSSKECVVDLKEKGTSKHKREKADHRSKISYVGAAKQRCIPPETQLTISWPQTTH
jgi:hypothetical protein